MVYSYYEELKGSVKCQYEEKYLDCFASILFATSASGTPM